MANERENMKRQPEEPKAVEMPFEVWFAMREAKIPKHHHREILKADFKAQGVPMMATQARWDAALKRYGVALA